MTSLHVGVLIAAVALIGLVHWYFFAAPRPMAKVASSRGGAREVVITVRGGYDPSTIRIPVGAPVKLVFDRQEDAGCSEEVVLPDFGIRRFLPAFSRTTIEVTAPKAGRYEFMCGMSMLRGALVAEVEA